jgi:hypothetical protein
VKEDFLHYVWQYKKFAFSNLTTVSGELVTIISVGQYLEQAGPDFFNAQLVIGSQLWAGTVEIHLKSSDWYVHHHEQDRNYDNVILHVVWEYDVPVFRKDNSEVPVLELRPYVSKSLLDPYRSLVTPKSWIFCETQIKGIDPIYFRHWMERLFFERLERKSIPIQQFLSSTENDWEAVLFYILAKNFGLNTNGALFLKVAQSIPFSVIRKERFELASLEALLFGQAGMLPLEAEDVYVRDLKERYAYLKQKYQLLAPIVEPVTFFKHRPDNFPTIRLAQLAALYHRHENLFTALIAVRSKAVLAELFSGSVSAYWQTHYQFDRASVGKKKKFSSSFIDLLAINTLVPLQFAYAQSLGKDVTESLMVLLQTIVSEKNSIVEKFATFGVKTKDAFETQSLLQLKQVYCDQRRCMQCAIGIQLLKT